MHQLMFLLLSLRGGELKVLIQVMVVVIIKLMLLMLIIIVLTQVIASSAAKKMQVYQYCLQRMHTIKLLAVTAITGIKVINLQLVAMLVLLELLMDSYQHYYGYFLCCFVAVRTVMVSQNLQLFLEINLAKDVVTLQIIITMMFIISGQVVQHQQDALVAMQLMPVDNLFKARYQVDSIGSLKAMVIIIIMAVVKIILFIVVVAESDCQTVLFDCYSLQHLHYSRMLAAKIISIAIAIIQPKRQSTTNSAAVVIAAAVVSAIVVVVIIIIIIAAIVTVVATMVAAVAVAITIVVEAAIVAVIVITIVIVIVVVAVKTILVELSWLLFVTVLGVEYYY